MKLKTKKSVSKRIRILKNKIKIRAGGQDHFNAKESGKVGRNKKRDKTISSVNVRNIKRFLPYN